MNMPGSPWTFSYPDLPVAEKRSAIADLVARHSVVILEGGTGSGKSTQLPKIILESGILRQGLLGITQPRRLAALTLADRLREETGIASLVGSQIRFQADMPDGARVKVMTDGVLLQEYRRDPLLRRYDAILLDEAHERSLNIDILLGIGLDLCRRRPELKWIVASATLDAERFQKFFATLPGGAALMRVEGRQFPVAIEYLDPGEGWGEPEEQEGGKDPSGSMTPLEAAGAAIRDIMAMRPDDLLCFLPTEKEINELARDLEKDLGNRCVILPLYGRLSPGEQRRVYQSHARPKVVLTTNIAETSLTIPGIAYVVDTGTARISRYHAQTRIQGLPIEKIAKASAAQRAGRAGRVKPGLCLRLYSREDFEARPEWPEPEILRGNLTNVVLQLLSLGLPVLEFPFLDMPTPAALKGAYRRLQELGAVDGEVETLKLTDQGWRMSRLPVDAALAKILLMAETMGILPPAMVVAAGLTVQDPRFLPLEEPERGKAVGLHRRFDDPRSDFVSILKLWAWLQKEWRDGYSQKRLRRLCQDHFLSFLRVREWMDLVEQFSRLLPGKGDPGAIDVEKLDTDALHKAMLSGFLAHIARRRANEPTYRLIGDKEAVIHPGSCLSKRRPEWIVAGELRQTSRTFIQRACEIKPTWVEEVAPDAVKRSYTEVAWNPERGFVEATERVSYRSFVLRQDRRVDFARVEPDTCAEIFWREGILRQGAAESFAFLQPNREAIAELERHETLSRRRNLAPDEETLLRFYREAAPEAHSRVSLRRLLEAEPARLQKLLLRAEDFEPPEMRAHWDTLARISSATSPGGLEKTTARAESGHPLERLFPRGLSVQNWTLSLSCRFDFGQELDGLSLEAPLPAAPFLTVSFLWAALPGWRLWIWQAWLEKLSAKEAETAMVHQGPIFMAWNESMRDMEKDAGLSPALGLNAALAQLDLPGLSSFPQWPSAWPPHLKLRIYYTAASGRRQLSLIDPGTCEAERVLHASELFYGREAQGKPWQDTLGRMREAWAEMPPRLAAAGLRWTPSLWPPPPAAAKPMAQGNTQDTPLEGYLWKPDGLASRFSGAMAELCSQADDLNTQPGEAAARLETGLRRRYEDLAYCLQVPQELQKTLAPWIDWQIRVFLPGQFALSPSFQGLRGSEEFLAKADALWRLPRNPGKSHGSAKSFKDLKPALSASGNAESAANWMLWVGCGFWGPGSMSLAHAPEAMRRMMDGYQAFTERKVPLSPAYLASAAGLSLGLVAPEPLAGIFPAHWQAWDEMWDPHRHRGNTGASGMPETSVSTGTLETKPRPEKAWAESLRDKLRVLGLLPQYWPAGWALSLDRFAAGQGEALILLRLMAYAAREGLKRGPKKASGSESSQAKPAALESLKDLRSRFKKL